MGLKAALLLQSDLEVKGQGTELIAALCRHLQAGGYVTFPMVRKHLDLDVINQHQIEVSWIRFQPPVYPQLWGDFINNLSVLDMLFNCGSKSSEIISGSSCG